MLIVKDFFLCRVRDITVFYVEFQVGSLNKDINMRNEV
jgi:hypothetical protein